jgi:hypothetical protein
LSALTFLPGTSPASRAEDAGSLLQGVECTRDPSSLALLLGYTLLEWVVIVASSFALFQGFRATRGFRPAGCPGSLAFMTLGSLVQVPGSEVGVQVASIVALTKIYGVPLEAASGIAILLWLVGSIAIVPFGLALRLPRRLNWSKLKLLSAKQILPGTWKEPQA